MAPGRIAITMHDGRVIDLALTPEEFDDLAVAFGRAARLDVVIWQIEALPGDATGLVYGQYWLVPR